MKTHLVCGLGQVGYRICHLLLRLGEKVEVITKETREEWVSELQSLGVRVHLKDARNSQVLIDAGIREAVSLTSVTGQDLINIEIGLDAKTLCPDLPVVLRIFDETLGDRLEETLQLRKAIGRSSLAAPVFASAVMKKIVCGSFAVDGQPFVIEEDGQLTAMERKNFPSHHLPRKTVWSNVIRTWKESTLPFGKVALFLLSVMAVSAVIFYFGMGLSVIDAIYFITTTITTVGYGDITPASGPLKLYVCLLMLLGSATIAAMYSWITDFIVTSKFQQLFGKTLTPEKDHVVLVGLGNIGYRIAEELQRLGIELVALETNPRALVETVRSFAPVIVGDGRTPETLEKAGIRTARAIIAATSDDSTNLTVVLVGRGLNPRIRTVARIFDAEFAEKIQKPLKVDVAYSASQIAAPTFVASALYENVVGAFVLNDANLFIFTYKKVREEWIGQTPSNLRKSTVDVLFRRNEKTDRFVSTLQDDSPFVREEQLIAVRVRNLIAAK